MSDRKAVLARWEKIGQLREEGKTFRQIGEIMGIHASRAHEIFLKWEKSKRRWVLHLTLPDDAAALREAAKAAAMVHGAFERQGYQLPENLGLPVRPENCLRNEHKLIRPYLLRPEHEHYRIMRMPNCGKKSAKIILLWAEVYRTTLRANGAPKWALTGDPYEYSEIGNVAASATQTSEKGR